MGPFAAIEFREFIRHYRKLDDAAIVADVQSSMDDLESLNADGKSFGAFMVAKMNARIAQNRERNRINGSKGGRPRKRPQDFETAVRVSGSGDAPVPCLTASTGPDREFLPGGAPSGNAGEPSAATTAHGQDIATRTRAGESADKGMSSNGPADGGSARGGRSPVAPGATEGPLIPSAPDPAPARSRKNLPALGEFRNVRISDGERAALVSEFGDVSPVVEELSSYKAATGKCYKNDYAALRNWLRRRNAEGKRPDGTKLTQGDRLAQIFAERERRIRNGDVPEDLLGM